MRSPIMSATRIVHTRNPAIQRIHVLTLLLLATLSSSSAWGYAISMQSTYPVRWPTPNLTFELNENGCKDITDGSDIRTVLACAQEWTDVDCSALVIQQQGTTTINDTVATTNQADNHNVITWINDSRWQFGAYVLGVTTPLFDRHGRISEADIAFNGFSTRWSTTGHRGTDVESVVLHEMGHFFGLQHVLEGNNMADPPTMAPAVDPHLRTRDLTRDDQLGACFLYPQTAPYTCANAAECPHVLDQDNQGQEYYSGSLLCVQNQCAGFQQVQQGTKQLGDTCTSDLDCANPNYCQPTSAGSYCSKQCTPNQSGACPANFTCMAFQGGTGGACFSDALISGSGSGSGGSTPPSNPCPCDRTFQCDPSCSCDPECTATTPPTPGGSGGSTGGGTPGSGGTTPGDQTPGSGTTPGTGTAGSGTGSGTGSGDSAGSGATNAGGPIDNNPTCACDVTYSCDKDAAAGGDCNCDLECGRGGGCNTLGHRTHHGAMLWPLLVIGVIVYQYRRRKVTKP